MQDAGHAMIDASDGLGVVPIVGTLTDLAVAGVAEASGDHELSQRKMNDATVDAIGDGLTLLTLPLGGIGGAAFKGGSTLVKAGAQTAVRTAVEAGVETTVKAVEKGAIGAVERTAINTGKRAGLESATLLQSRIGVHTSEQTVKLAAAEQAIKAATTRTGTQAAELAAKREAAEAATKAAEVAAKREAAAAATKAAEREAVVQAEKAALRAGAKGATKHSIKKSVAKFLAKGTLERATVNAAVDNLLPTLFPGVKSNTQNEVGPSDGSAPHTLMGSFEQYLPYLVGGGVAVFVPGSIIKKIALGGGAGLATIFIIDHHLFGA